MPFGLVKPTNPMQEDREEQWVGKIAGKGMEFLRYLPFQATP